jgi:exopolysaccharide biosynthesis polyprenyl glycosylphosphotransferase
MQENLQSYSAEGRASLAEASQNSVRSFPLPPRLLPHQTNQLERSGIAFSMRASAPPAGNQCGLLTAPERLIKRALDIVLALLALGLLIPLLCIVAIAIKFDSPGPIIFQQRRNGLNGIPFVVFKFRTMSVLEDGPTITQVRRGDDRVTRLGYFLRRTSADELPQLLNVLKGDMSLVGPRPHALAHDIKYQALIDNYSFRYDVKPGMTGWAQVNGSRGETHCLEQMAERVSLDLWYINHWSLGLDIYILLRTCFAVFRDGAY